MRRKKTSKSAALAASANARAAVLGATREGPLKAEQRLDQRLRTCVAVTCTFLTIRWFASPSARARLPNASNFTPPEISLPLSSDRLHLAFDDFYHSNVQPLVDLGLKTFNGTNHDVGEKSRVGYKLHKQNARAKHPIVMIPGFVTTGLELWEGTNCGKKHFRQRLWGGASMARTFFADRECWRKHLALDPQTGMDPSNIRLRAAQGFEAADNFVATYWVWSKVIENLADVGYDGSNMSMMSYDWRLAYEHLETRDGYFTKLKATIEAHHSTTGEKVVMISHSMGGTVCYYFLQWVVAQAKVGGGGGGKDWIEKHVEAFINISGTLLGVPKAIPALLSGELKDTAVLFPQLGELLEQYFGRRWRRNLWITWGSLFGMLPKGGDAIWGTGADLVYNKDSKDEDTNTNHTDIPSQETLKKPSLYPTVVWNNGTGDICPSSSVVPPNISPTANSSLNGEGFSELNTPPSRTWSMEKTIDYLFQHGGGSSSTFSPDAKQGWKIRATSKDKRRHWSDPVATPLPKAPSLKIYCLYGTGLNTERSYYYKVMCENIDGASNSEHNQTSSEDIRSDQNKTQVLQCKNTTTLGVPTQEESREAPFSIDINAKDPSQNVQSGVQFSDGDGTVPLISLGYMCQKWSQPKNKHNPSSIKVYTRERKSEKQQMSLSDPGRGGPKSADHVDILGNLGVIEDLVRVATGFEVEEKVNEDRIESELKDIVQRIDGHGGLNSFLR